MLHLTLILDTGLVQNYSSEAEDCNPQKLKNSINYKI
uniref:Uncharacterized protein n=1 Tax=Anguilla anguilla TaxID=7936 RepID=A0A0E9WKH4_ANGAN